MTYGCKELLSLLVGDLTYLTKVTECMIYYESVCHQNDFEAVICRQGWEDYLGNAIGYRLLVTLFKME